MGRTVEYGNFEWDTEKAWLNLAKHKVSFEEAATVFDDLFFFAYKDLKALHRRRLLCYHWHVRKKSAVDDRLFRTQTCANNKRPQIESHETQLYQEESREAL